jgi:hypothetical protein
MRMRQPPENSLVARPKSAQGLFYVGLAGVAAEDVVVVLRVVEAVYERGVFVRLVIGALGDLRGQRLYLGFEAQNLVESLFGLGLQSGGVGHAHLLGQVTYRALAVHGHRARSGLLFARDDAQQGGFARAVLAYQTYAILGIYEKRYVVEEGPPSVTYREIV